MDGNLLAKFDNKKFFKRCRELGLFKTLSNSQVSGIEFILEGWHLSGLTDLRWLAYMLATVHWETAQTFQPIKEQGSLTYLKSKKYWPYYGRGYVQLTWKENYAYMTELYNDSHGTDYNFVQNPDLVQQPRIARWVLFEGMTKGGSSRGDFTGKSLEDYFNDQKTDWENARRIINGTDKARTIAEIAKKYHNAVKYASGWR